MHDEQPVGEYPALPPRFRINISTNSTEFADKVRRIIELTRLQDRLPDWTRE